MIFGIYFTVFLITIFALMFSIEEKPRTREGIVNEASLFMMIGLFWPIGIPALLIRKFARSRG